MSKPNLLLTDPLIQPVVPSNASGKKILAVLLSLVGLGCTLLWVHDEHSGSLGAVNMALQSWQPATLGQSMRPVNARQRMPAMRAWQPMRSPPDFKSTSDEIMKEGPATMKEFPLGKRELIAAMLAGGSVLSGPAFALIPDDEDNELVAKAKANRKAKIQKEKKVERAADLSGGGGYSLRLDEELYPIQVAVKQLMVAGTEVKNGDLGAAAKALNDPGSLVADLNKAILKVSDAQDERVLAINVEKSVRGFQEAVNSNKAPEAKTKFKAVADSLKEWSEAAQVDTLLRGIAPAPPPAPAPA